MLFLISSVIHCYPTKRNFMLLPLQRPTQGLTKSPTEKKGIQVIVKRWIFPEKGRVIDFYSNYIVIIISENTESTLKILDLEHSMNYMRPDIVLCSIVRFEVFTAVTMKNGVFWAVRPCGSCKNRRFGGTWYFFTAYVGC
jgi:hypothetical protein